MQIEYRMYKNIIKNRKMMVRNSNCLPFAVRVAFSKGFQGSGEHNGLADVGEEYSRWEKSWFEILTAFRLR